MKDRWAKRRELQGLLLDVTGCSIQYSGWPCGTCFGVLGLSDGAWHATLVLRGDYKDGDFGIDMPDDRLTEEVDRMLTALKGA